VKYVSFFISQKCLTFSIEFADTYCTRKYQYDSGIHFILSGRPLISKNR
jgi:hypothetical protein